MFAERFPVFPTVFSAPRDVCRDRANILWTRNSTLSRINCAVFIVTLFMSGD